MQDRVPTPGQEGRVLVTPENGGSPFYATIQMADNPSVPGTPWAKESVLQDSVATLIGLTSAAVPNDMFNVLAHAGDLYVWKRTQNGQVDYPVSTNPDAYQVGSDAQPAGYTLGPVQSGQFKLTTDSDLYDPSVLYNYGSSISVSSDGSLSLAFDGSVSAQRYQPTYDQLSVLKGKFIQATTPGLASWTGDFSIGVIYYIPETSTLSNLSNGTPFFTQIQTVTGYAAIPAGTTIEYMGQVGAKARVVTGSYVGNGTIGPNAPNTLEFDANPSLLIIETDVLTFPTSLTIIAFTGSSYALSGMTIYQITGSLSSETGTLAAKCSDGVVSWYHVSESSINAQANVNGVKYTYRAFF